MFDPDIPQWQPLLFPGAKEPELWQTPKWPTTSTMYKNTVKTKSFLTNYHIEELIGSAWHPFLIHNNLKSAQSDMDYYQKEWGGKFRIVSVLEETKD